MELSVVIVSFNTKELLRHCLTSLLASLRRWQLAAEIIVIDNVSTDGTREMLQGEFPTIRTIFNRENVGFGRANNQGIKLAKGEYVLLLNSDTVTLNNAIGKLLDFAHSHPQSFVGPKLVNSDRSPQTSCGPFFTLPVVFAALFLRGDRFGLTRWSPTRVQQVDWVSGACLLGKRALFLDDLLFDENIFMYMEEIDLLYRASQKGIKTYFYPGSQVIHVGSASSPTKRKGPVLNIYRGLLYFYKKHYRPWQLRILKVLLKLKAQMALIVGILTGDEYLKSTYAEAYQLV